MFCHFLYLNSEVMLFCTINRIPLKPFSSCREDWGKGVGCVGLVGKLLAEMGYKEWHYFRNHLKVQGAFLSSTTREAGEAREAPRPLLPAS
jgi:hypothetical protein